jgi:uncharacterized protein (DUF58 family)
MKKKRWIFTIRKLVNNIFAGTFPSAKKGAGGIEFAGFREYQPGDAVRSISYRESLKRCRYFVRENIVEKGAVCLFIIDRSASVLFGPSGISKWEMENRILDILAPAIAKNNNQVGFLITTDCVEQYFAPKFGVKSAAERLTLISYYQPKSKLTDLNAAFQFILERNIPADLIFVLSDFYAENPLEDSLKALSGKYDVILLLLKDPSETTSFPEVKGGMIAFKDLETGKFLWGDRPQKISNKVLFEKLGLDYALLRTDKDEEEWVQKLMIIFEQRKKRRRVK